MIPSTSTLGYCEKSRFLGRHTEHENPRNRTFAILIGMAMYRADRIHHHLLSQKELTSKIHTKLWVTTLKWSLHASTGNGKLLASMIKASAKFHIFFFLITHNRLANSTQLSHHIVVSLMNEYHTFHWDFPSTFPTPFNFFATLCSAGLWSYLVPALDLFFPEVSPAWKNVLWYSPAPVRSSKLSFYQKAFQIPPPLKITLRILTQNQVSLFCTEVSGNKPYLVLQS